MRGRHQVNLESLHLFVLAVKLGSISKAASEMNIALAAASRRIKNLEEFYGARLFDRTGRGVEATSAGKVLLEHANHVFRRLDIAARDLVDYASGLIGTVKLYACTSAIAQFLPNDLSRFAAIHPDTRVDLREAYTGNIVSLIREGLADVGIVMAGPITDGLDIVPYKEDRLAIVAPSDFHEDIDKMRFADLHDESFVLLEGNAAMTRLLQSVATTTGMPLRIRAQVDSFDGVCRMVQSGFGIGILPVVAARNLTYSLGLRLIDLDETWAVRKFAICTNPRFPATLAMSRIVEFLGKQGNSSEESARKPVATI